MVLQTPFYFFLSHKQALDVPRRWAFSSHWLHRVLAGTKLEMIGLENIPDGGCIIASKHQSVWEFYSLYAVMKDPVFVLKAELMKIPFFGWFVAKIDQIPIRRGDKGSAMRRMIKDAKVKISDDRQIIIFPEGTRKTPGDVPNYRYGVTRMYLDLNCPVVPVALNSGLFWPRRKFVRHPGTITAHYLEPILPGLSADEFSAELERRIEDACDDLYLKASEAPVPPPISSLVQTRIDIAMKRREKRNRS